MREPFTLIEMGLNTIGVIAEEMRLISKPAFQQQRTWYTCSAQCVAYIERLYGQCTPVSAIARSITKLFIGTDSMDTAEYLSKLGYIVAVEYIPIWDIKEALRNPGMGIVRVWLDNGTAHHIVLIGRGSGQQKKKLLIIDPRERNPLSYITPRNLIHYCKSDYQDSTEVEVIWVDRDL